MTLFLLPGYLKTNKQESIAQQNASRNKANPWISLTTCEAVHDIVEVTHGSPPAQMSSGRFVSSSGQLSPAGPLAQGRKMLLWLLPPWAVGLAGTTS